MKWADGDESSTLTPELHIGTHQVDDIDRQPDSVFDFVVNCEGHRIPNETRSGRLSTRVSSLRAGAGIPGSALRANLGLDRKNT